MLGGLVIVDTVDGITRDKIYAMTKPLELPTVPFESKKKFLDWLAKNHDTSAGVWIKLAKKGTRIPSVTIEEALDVALSYGWIDGQRVSFDESYYLQKYTPRRPKSNWSKINTEKVKRLIANGEMKPAGMKAVDSAKQDGRWDAAYESQKIMTVPADFQSVLNKNKKAKAFFETLTGSRRYLFLFKIETAKKAETREKRIRQFVEMLERGETF
jgi:uncharacterized protein YdeI (YjbR/CyaY-like superfamily)